MSFAYLMFLAGMLVGSFLASLLTCLLIKKLYRVLPKYPYRWTCPVAGCRYEYSSTSAEMTLEDAEVHSQVPHDENGNY